jgi:hypothetical protein
MEASGVLGNDSGAGFEIWGSGFRDYKGTSLIRKRLPVGPYSSPLPRALWWSYGGGAFSFQRGTPVEVEVQDAGSREPSVWFA